ncbi:hypothetical protein [Enorma phocaeensis]|uniref:hypothetical protein n=1 Tax=Enorma phocaeensis TaxID=1871019 RepID=UPI00235557B2|nr:hypothetical protein [Enorma phocaeensis]
MGNLTRRNFLLGSLGVASMFGLAACGNNSTNQDSGTQDATEEPQEQEEITKYAVGDTVESDLVRLTLNNAAFAIALNNSLDIGTGFSIDNDYFCPKEYVAEEDSDNPYVAPKGSTLVFFELLVENLDRDFLELDTGTGSEFLSVTYNNSTYTGSDFEEKEYGWNVDDVEGAQDWDSQTVTNMLLSVGVKELHRGYAEVPFEPESLTDPFEITFQLPKSDDTTEFFTFAVNQ